MPADNHTVDIKVQNCQHANSRSFFVFLSNIAAKKYSIPFFWAFAFFCLFVSAKVAGFNVLNITGEIHEDSTFLYLMDYRLGFASRLFVGAVVGLFTDRITPTLIYQIAGYSVLVSVLLHALLGGLVLRKSIEKREYLITLFTLVFLLHSLTATQNLRIKGWQDSYIFILVLLWFFLFDRFASVVTAPVLCMICMLIHYSFIFTFMPPVLALMFYGMFFSAKKAKRVCCGVSFGVGSATVLSLFFYFVFFANDHLKMTRDELYAYMESRYQLTAMEEIHMRRIFSGDLFFRFFPDLYFFNRGLDTGEFSSIKQVLEYIRGEVVAYVRPSVYLKFAVLFLPVFIVFAALWIACMRRAEGAKKLPYIVFIGMSVTLLPACFISADVWRWISAGIIVQFLVLFALYRIGDAALLAVVHGERFKQTPVIIVLCSLCAAYIAFSMWFCVNLPIVQ